MLPDSLPDVSLAAILDALPDGVAWMLPIYGEQDDVVNFRLAYRNAIAQNLTGNTLQMQIGSYLPGNTPDQFPRADESFQALLAVYQSGEPAQQTYYSEDLTRWISVSRSLLNGGILSVMRDVTPGKVAENVLTSINTTQALAATEASVLAATNLQQIIDVAQTGIAMLEPIVDENDQILDFRFVTANRIVAQMVGQTTDVILNTPTSNWFTSYRETNVFDFYKRTYTTGEAQRFDINYDVDGFDIWLDVQSVKLGKFVMVTFTDYTLLKQVQEALEQQAADNQRQADLLNSVLDSSGSGIMAFEAIRNPAEENRIVDFRFIVANQACVGLVGKSIEEMVGKPLLSIFPGNVESGLFDLYKQTTETGKPGRTEVYYNLDGLNFWFDISAQKLGDGFVVTFTDVSPLKRANKAIEASAAELTTVIDTAQAGIFLFEPVFDEQNEVTDFRFRLANRQLAAYVGQEPAALIGELGSRWFPGYKTNGLFDTYLKAYQTGRTQRFDFHYDGDGIDVWLDIMATKMGNEVLVTFADYTSLKRVQRQLEHSIVDLSRSNESLQQFAYVASHDLQEPLRKIQSFGDVMQARFGPELGDVGSDMIGRMQTAAGRMSTLIHDLLTYSRLSAKPAEMKPIALANVLARVLDDLDLPIRESGATIKVDSLPTLPGDESQLRQLFQNLLTNALKFRQADTTPLITISSRTVDAAELPELVPTRKVPVYQCVTVKDNGIGFDQKYADRIFQVFQRLHGRAQYDGTGIGLAIVQRVIDNHGGAIRASSKPGHGATFELYLPA